MSNIAFNCPGCQQQLEGSVEMAGETVECPNCGQQMIVPEPPKESATLDDISFGGDSAGQPKPELSEATLDDMSFGEDAPPPNPPVPNVFETLAAEQEEEAVPEAEPEPAPPAPEAAAGNTCPDCGADMAEAAVLCLACGFHTGLGKKIGTDLG